MKALGLLGLLVLFASASSAEEARRIPIEQRFLVASLNGMDFGNRTLTLTVGRDPRGGGLRGRGFAGCNTWFGRVSIGEGDRFSVEQIGTTRKYCTAARMRLEQDFLAALRSVTRWRMEGSTLILAGEKSTLHLVPVTRRA
ncbi:MAG: heat shock protein HslJ [Alphaproteobacteria bacterium]|jgi:heat shock protein HslJ|nr:heat shock protein HslJ [Alphaproteobacteria bacterium]